jgi:thioester reductase-like protein
MNSIINYLEKWAEVQPTKCISSFLDISGREKQSYTYKQFTDATYSLAQYLFQDIGIRHGERVLLIYPPGLDIIVAFIACARIGAIPVPVSPPTSTRFEVSYSKLVLICSDCQPQIALATKKIYESYCLLKARKQPFVNSNQDFSKLKWIATDDLDIEKPNKLTTLDNPNSILFLQYTSGSTGDPKGVMVSHENIIHNALSTINHVPIGVSWLPQHHDMGLIGYYLFPIITGGTTYGFSPFDFLKRPILWLETISRVKATYTSSPNFGFEYCLREDKVSLAQLHKIDLSSLRVLMNASEPVQVNTYSRFLERFKPYGLRTKAHTAAYGLAENTLTVTHYGSRIVSVDRQLLKQGKVSIETYKEDSEKQRNIISCGEPIEGVSIKIVDRQNNRPLDERQIGEIWISGNSACKGYWNRPRLTKKVFKNSLPKKSLHESNNNYIRTGDLGFMYDNELYVCGRLKDLIIVRGANYYPDDIEFILQAAFVSLHLGGIVAFNNSEDSGEVTVLIEVRSQEEIPSAEKIVYTLRTQCDITPDIIAFIPPNTIAKTTSGKVARSITRERFLDGSLPTIEVLRFNKQQEDFQSLPEATQRFKAILNSYSLKGDENYKFSEIGMDSLTSAQLMIEIEYLLVEKGAQDLIEDIDIQFLQQLTVRDFFQLMRQFSSSSSETIKTWKCYLKSVTHEHTNYIRDQMQSDALFKNKTFEAICANENLENNILITGATGFLGPFLLSSLLTQTSYTFYIIVRAKSTSHGIERIRESLYNSSLLTPFVENELKQRVHVICGDISLHNLGLPLSEWKALSREIKVVFHNAALVNYVKNYDVLRPHNVNGTRELLRFSFAGRRKEFHYISTTFIFGWSSRGNLFETDNNEEMENLDFGYSQTKWVAEQMVFAAKKQGLPVRVYRPSLISASTQGIWENSDIAVRLLAFMINHRLGVYSQNQISFLPVDIVANNIVSIFKSPKSDNITLHVTTDKYYNMVDITKLISSKYGYTFEYHDISGFIREMNQRCTKDDPLFPLLNFFNRSYGKIVEMQLKRYNNQNYSIARLNSQSVYSEPPLEEVVSCIMTYMFKSELIK